MRIYLFTSLNIFPLDIITLFPDAAPQFKFTPPLGLFTLAGGVKGRKDCEVRIIDLNREAAALKADHKDLLPGLYSAIHGIISGGTPAGERIVAGFQTLCTSHHTALYLAERLKRDIPDAVVLFGGPQASAVAKPTLEAFPYVDYVLAGEADLAFPEFIDALAGARAPSTVGGLYFRDVSGRVNEPRPPQVPADLDRLPFPDYDCYPYPIQEFLLEAGRGCPYSCAYCFTGKFFSRKCRYKSAARISAEIADLNARFGRVAGVSFQHDNLFGDPKAAIELCKELRKISEATGLRWNCFLRLDSIKDPQLGTLLKEAGCNKVFIGIESGSERIQKLINKYRDVSAAYRVIPQLHASGLQIDLGYMTEFPEETPDDLEKTLRLAAFTRLYDVNYQINPLMVYSGTKVFEDYKERLVYDPGRDTTDYNARFFDHSETQGMFRLSPEIFSVFYSLPLRHPELKGLATMAHFVSRSFNHTCLAIVNWSDGVRRLVDIFLALKRHWSPDREAFMRAFEGWVSEEFGGNRAIMEVFRYERDCYDSVLTEKYARSGGSCAAANMRMIEEHGFRRLAAAPGDRTIRSNYALTSSMLTATFKQGLAAGQALPPPALTDEDRAYFIKGSVNKSEKAFNIEVYRYPAVAGRIYDAVTSGKTPIGELAAEQLPDIPYIQTAQWVSLFSSKGLICLTTPPRN